VVIGLEVHIQLATASKAFCGCNNLYGAAANTLACPICLGYPGALPMFNRQALVLASRLALALGCKLEPHSVFSRKNYYYPDLPKGFQISQYDLPLATNGVLEFMDDGQTLNCGIERVHLEEDVAKAVHGTDAAGNECTKLDYNRSGVPLVEVVGKPELTSPHAARHYLEELQRLVRSTGASECDMEKGSLRVDVNVSLRNSDGSFGTKIEVKNLNSFRAVERALEYEIERQGELLGRGERFQRETRLWDEKGAATVLMRVKEGTDDYRYFPEPDLPAITTDEAFKRTVWDGMVADCWLGFDELPLQREQWCLAQGIPPDDARIYAADVVLYHQLRQAWEKRPNTDVSTQLIQYIRPLYTWEMEHNIARRLPPVDFLIRFAQAIAEKKVTGGSTGSTAFWKAWYEKDESSLPKTAMELAKELGLTIEEVDAGELDRLIAAAMEANPAAVAAVKGGKDGAVGPLVGQVLKALGGKADAQMIRKAILQRIAET
jgi:aspartyl-tRNA(Asn)/glutamyl-tRNA(Gln) amidotransferase subunit B